MFCPHCGSSNTEGATFCTNCGKPVSGAGQPPQTSPTPTPAGGQFGHPFTTPPLSGNDEPLEIWMGAIALCFPIVGAILYFVWKRDKPKKAKQVCLVSVIGFGISIFLYLLMALVQV